ncbi:uncharacterized protein DS421_3g67250 [Arachis hypogaea]|nr:uncharacterized protein DS421_3g67250 [Arachis hypogaea]
MPRPLYLKRKTIVTDTKKSFKLETEKIRLMATKHGPKSKLTHFTQLHHFRTHSLINLNKALSICLSIRLSNLIPFSPPPSILFFRFISLFHRFHFSFLSSFFAPKTLDLYLSH